MEHNYTYQGTLAAAERVGWRVEDLIGGDKALDFSRPFLPESLARTGEVSYLSAVEQRTLNQIRGHGYLCTFGLVEEFILPFVLDHARPQLHADDYRIRALLQFATEEAKHIHLFKSFRREFEQGFGESCGVIGPPSEVARTVLSHHPLAVALAILQIEWMTQAHYVDSVRDDGGMDPQFKNLLKHHWANGNCSSPNGFGAGPPWAPPGVPVMTARLSKSDYSAELAIRLPGYRFDGPDGVAGRSIVVHAGGQGSLLAEPGVTNNRVACGVIRTPQHLLPAPQN